MRAAHFVEDLSLDAKRYWLVEPYRDFDYVIVAPEPSLGRTTIYAATDHSDLGDLTDEGGEPIVLATFEGQIAPDDALSKIGYEVAGSLLEEDEQSLMEASEDANGR